MSLGELLPVLGKLAKAQRRLAAGSVWASVPVPEPVQLLQALDLALVQHTQA